MNEVFPDWLLVIILTILLVLISLRTMRSGLRLRAAELRSEEENAQVWLAVLLVKILHHRHPGLMHRWTSLTSFQTNMAGKLRSAAQPSNSLVGTWHCDSRLGVSLSDLVDVISS